MTTNDPKNYWADVSGLNMKITKSEQGFTGTTTIYGINGEILQEDNFSITWEELKEKVQDTITRVVKEQSSL